MQKNHLLIFSRGPSWVSDGGVVRTLHILERELVMGVGHVVALLVDTRVPRQNGCRKRRCHFRRPG